MSVATPRAGHMDESLCLCVAVALCGCTMEYEERAGLQVCGCECYVCSIAQALHRGLAMHVCSGCVCSAALAPCCPATHVHQVLPRLLHGYLNLVLLSYRGVWMDCSSKESSDVVWILMRDV